MADHFEEVVGLRLSALETRVDAEAESVKEHFLEQQQFITFSLTGMAERLRTERRADLNAGLAEVKGEIRRVDERLDTVERKMDAYHDATQTILRDILRRLPPGPAAA